MAKTLAKSSQSETTTHRGSGYGLLLPVSLLWFVKKFSTIDKNTPDKRYTHDG